MKIDPFTGHLHAVARRRAIKDVIAEHRAAPYYPATRVHEPPSTKDLLRSQLTLWLASWLMPKRKD